MSLNIQQIALLQKVRKSVKIFQQNHPKFFPFLNAISQQAIQEDTIIEITVTSPDGNHFTTNLKLKQDDVEFIELLRQLNP
ncbi:MAG: hypothetical protein IAA25_09340 [Candidatus Ruminococcus intestinipullorum]|nr:hypothetical protein [Candidatus Ruminococcus intestinipullorum]